MRRMQIFCVGALAVLATLGLGSLAPPLYAGGLFARHTQVNVAAGVVSPVQSVQVRQGLLGLRTQVHVNAAPAVVSPVQAVTVQRGLGLFAPRAGVQVSVGPSAYVNSQLLV